MEPCTQQMVPEWAQDKDINTVMSTKWSVSSYIIMLVSILFLLFLYASYSVFISDKKVEYILSPKWHSLPYLLSLKHITNTLFIGCWGL